MPILRPYQEECLSAIPEAGRCLAVLPTGTGKTVIFSELTKRRWRHGRVLILVHRDELVRQTVTKLDDSGVTNIGVIKADRNDVANDVVVASIQTLSREKRLTEYLEYGQPQTIVVDEAHHAPATSYRSVINACLPGDRDPNPGLLLGVTATPDRETEKKVKDNWGWTHHKMTAGMAAVFDELVYYYALEEAISSGFLSDLTARRITARLDLSNVKTRGGDFADDDLADALEAADVPEIIAKSWVEQANGRPTLAFLPTVKTSMDTMVSLQALGIPAAHIDGNTGTEVRQTLYRSLREGRLKVITNCMVLTEGFDEPSVSCVVIGRPTKNRLLYAQMVGRGTRLAPNKEDCLVLDLVGASNMRLDIDPITLQSFLDDPGMEEGQSWKRRQKQLAEQAPATMTSDEIRARSKAIRVLAEHADIFQRTSEMKRSWLRVGPEWRIKAGLSKMFILKPEDGDQRRWLVGAEIEGKRQRINPEVLSLPAAVGWVEEQLAGLPAEDRHWSNPEAAWKKTAPSEKQVAFAVKLGLGVKTELEELSKGELSDLIDAKLAESKQRRGA